MFKGIVKIMVYVISALLIFLGSVFMISFNLGITYFIVGVIFILTALALLILPRERKPVEIKQTIYVSGPVKVREVRCPVCGALIDLAKVKVVAGRTIVACSYCGNNFEVTEEPLW
jgi:predicted membrane protein